MNTKEPRISVRISQELKNRIEKIIQITGIDEATLVRNCIEALCCHVEKNGQISFPMAIHSKISIQAITNASDSIKNESVKKKEIHHATKPIEETEKEPRGNQPRADGLPKLWAEDEKRKRKAGQF